MHKSLVSILTRLYKFARLAGLESAPNLTSTRENKKPIREIFRFSSREKKRSIREKILKSARETLALPVKKS